jgi:hypothetical protein
MTNAPWYVSNDTLLNDLGIPIISDVYKECSNKHHNRLDIHQSIDSAATRRTKLQTVKKTSPNWSRVNLWGLLRWKGLHPLIVGLITLLIVNSDCWLNKYIKKTFPSGEELSFLHSVRTRSVAHPTPPYNGYWGGGAFSRGQKTGT